MSISEVVNQEETLSSDEVSSDYIGDENEGSPQDEGLSSDESGDGNDSEQQEDILIDENLGILEDILGDILDEA